MAGYSALESLDQWIARRVRNRELANVFDGWELDAEEPEYENKGGIGRLRLVGRDQEVVNRITHALERML